MTFPLFLQLFVCSNIIGPEGLLKRKTRVLCTNSVAYLSEMDQIFVMKDGRISEQGTYNELLAEQGEFADFLVQYLTEEGEKELVNVASNIYKRNFYPLINLLLGPTN